MVQGLWCSCTTPATSNGTNFVYVVPAPSESMYSYYYSVLNLSFWKSSKNRKFFQPFWGVFSKTHKNHAQRGKITGKCTHGQTQYAFYIIQLCALRFAFALETQTEQSCVLKSCLCNNLTLLY